jgi:hypothetical protein
LLPIYVLAGGLAYFFVLVRLRTIKKRDVDLFEEYLPHELKWIADWARHRLAASP